MTKTSSLRIGFDARYVNDRYHGIGRYAFRLLEALVKTTPQHTFVVFRGPVSDGRFDWQELAACRNVEFHAGPWPLYWPQEQLTWLPALRRARVDLLHTPYFVAPLLATTPVITTIHDLIFDRYPQYMPMAWSRPYYRLLMAAGARRAKRIITVSEATRRDLQAYYHVAPEKVTAIPEGVDSGFHPLQNPALARELRQRYDLEAPYIFTVGARRPHKNMAALVRAFAGLGDLPHRLVFAGPPDGRFPDDARQAAQSVGLDGRVRFLEWVPEADLPGLYSQADLVALPSLIEGFGLPALEAMACGAPVLAANNTSFPEVVGQAGLLMDPFDEAGMAQAMRRALEDAPLRQRLQSEGKQRAAEFTWEKAAALTMQVYEKAAA